MKPMTIGFSVLAAFLWIPLAAMAQATVHERVRDTPMGGEVSLTRSSMYPSMDVPSLLKLSDLVIEGFIDQADGALTKDDRFVATTYNFRSELVLFSRSSGMAVPGAGISSVRVRHEGGQVTVDGRVVHAVETLRPFMVGSRMILFLRKDPSEGDVYQVIDGPYGTFGTEGGRVRSSAAITDAAIKGLYDGVELTAFRALVQEAGASSIRR